MSGSPPLTSPASLPPVPTAPRTTNSARPVALISGASSGIGAALAEALAAKGHALVLAARRTELLAAVAERAGVPRDDVLCVTCDVTEEPAVAELVRSAVLWRGRLDVVVACAGEYLRKPAAELERADLDRALGVNFFGAFRLAQAALPALRESGGHLVLVNSFDAKKGMPLEAAYVAAKCALAGYAGVLRQEERGVHVCTVFPGRVDTPMIRHLDVPRISAKIPPERVARAVLRALATRRAEVIVPWTCRLLQVADVVSPRLADGLVRLLRLEGRPRE